MNKHSLSAKIASSTLLALLIVGVSAIFPPANQNKVATAKQGADDPAGDDRGGSSKSGSGGSSKSGSSSKNRSGSDSSRSSSSNSGSSSNQGPSSSSGSGQAVQLQSGDDNSGRSGSSDDSSSQSGKDLGKDAAKEIDSALGDVAKVQRKIDRVVVRNMSADQFKKMMGDSQELLVRSQQLLASGDAVQANALAEQADDLLKRANDGLESLLGPEDNPNRVGDDNGVRREDRRADRREDRGGAFEFENESVRHQGVMGNVVGQLLMVAKMEDSIGDDRSRGIGREVRVIAQEQDNARGRISQSLKEIDGRGSITRLLVGPKFGEIKKVKNEIELNKQRVKKLEDLERGMEGEGLKAQLQLQREVIERENERLEQEIEIEDNRGSLLGWLFRMMS